MLSKLPKSQNTLKNVSQEANREKMTMKPKHIDLEAILEPFWSHLGVLGRPLGAILGHLGANLSQHKAILSHLGANLKPPGANISQHEPTWRPRNPSGWLKKAATNVGGATAKPQRSNFWPQDRLGEG